jgi:hypothetical protein
MLLGPFGVREIDDVADGGRAGEDHQRDDFHWGQGGKRPRA